jgi:hypothetical protein
MNILLINTNPVVSRLIALCVANRDVVFEEVSAVVTVVLDRYDVVFVDEDSYDDELKKILKNFMIRKKVFLTTKDSNKSDFEEFDEVIKKPFLPSQITTVIENMFNDSNDVEIVEDHFIFPLAVESKNSEDEIVEAKDKESKVLDSSEIEKIKALLEDEEESKSVKLEDDADYESRKIEVITKHLEDDGLEIVREDEYVEILSKKAQKAKKKKIKKKLEKKKMANSKSTKKEKIISFEEALVAAVKDMKIKKIKKLLKDADITIKINFKDNK